MKKPFTRPISLTSARTGKRLRLLDLPPGTALVPVLTPEPILGYTYQRGHLTVYVAAPMRDLYRAIIAWAKPARRRKWKRPVGNTSMAAAPPTPPPWPRC